MWYKSLLFFVVSLILLLPGNINADKNNGNQINKNAIQLYLSEDLVSCQRKGLLDTVQYFEKSWNAKNSFEILNFNQKITQYSYHTIPWRTIVVTAHLKNKVVDVTGKEKDALTNMLLGEAIANKKEVFKGLIKLIKGRCYHQEIYLHEFAHAFGQKHVKTSGNIMTEVVNFPFKFNGRQLEDMKRVALGFIL